MNRKLLREPGLLAVILIITSALVLFILLPMVRVFTYPNLSTFASMLSHPRYIRATRNSLVMMVMSTTLATLLGFIFAYTFVKTDIPFKRFFKFVSLLPLFSPPFMVAFSYLMMFGKSGIITWQLFGVRTNILGWHGLLLAQSIAFFPVAAIAIEGVLQGISPSLEYAGRNLGAGGWNIFRTITLPLSRPGIAGAALLVSILVLADFGNPIIIAGDYAVLATEAWLRVEGWADVSGAAVLSSILLIPSLIIFFLQRYWIGQRSYITISGKISQMRREKTAWYVKTLLLTVCSLVTLLIILVYVALVMGAFVRGWGFDWTPTTRWFMRVITGSRELLRSVLYSVTAGALTAVFSITAAFLVIRQRFPLRKFMDFTCILPAALPGIFLGMGYSISFTVPPVDLYGTASIIILSMVFWNISIGYQSGVGALQQISPSLGEAASNLGSKALSIFLHIELPLIKNSFFSAFVVSFIRSITTLSVIVFISTSRNSVATFSIMNLVNDGYYGKAAALTTSLLVISFSVLAIAKACIGKSAELYKI